VEPLRAKDLWRVETRSGDLVGAVEVGSLTGSGTGTPGLYIAGDVGGNIDVLYNFHSQAAIDIDGSFLGGNTLYIGDFLPQANSIRIWEDLLGDIDIIDSDGLKGQIIVNSADVGGEWLGEVTVGTVTLGPDPFYNQTGLGGGAVGEVAFGLHRYESDPPYVNGDWPDVFESHPTITLVHYGPVAWGSGAKPFKVYESVDDHCTACFHGNLYDVTDDWNVVGGTGRELIIEPDSGATGVQVDYHYHIRPVRSGSNMLFCDGIAAQDVPVADYEDYIIYRPN